MKSKEPAYRSRYWRKWRLKNRPYKHLNCSICHRHFHQRSNAQKRCDKCRTLQCHSCKRPFLSANARMNQKFCCRRCQDDALLGSEPIWLQQNRGRKPRTYHLRHRDKHGSAADRDWRKAVFERDDYTCQLCWQRGGRLQADHIKPFKRFPELRHVLSNGRTLCEPCHRKTETYGWSAYWYKRQTLGTGGL